MSAPAFEAGRKAKDRNVKQSVEWRYALTMKDHELIDLLRKLAQCLDNSLPFVSHFRKMKKQFEKFQKEVMPPQVAEKCYKLYGKPVGERFNSEMVTLLEAGKSLHEAFSYFPRIFSPFVLTMVQVGEMSGAATPVFRNLAEFLESSRRTKNELRNMAIYPAAVTIIGTILIGVILTKLVPTMRDAYAALLGPGVRFNPFSEFILGISAFLESYWWLVGLGVFVGFTAYRQLRRTVTAIRRFEDDLILSIPLVGRYVFFTELYSFFYAWKVMRNSQITERVALPVLAEIFRNTQLRDAARDAAALMGKESSMKMSEALARATHYFHPLSDPYGVIAHYEETGDSGHVDRFIEQLKADGDSLRERITKMIEPFVLCALGIVIGSIVIAMILPYFELIGKLAGGTGPK